MKLIYPNYYKNFKCLQSACRHNCCIGWEIDVDEQTMELYRQLPFVLAHIEGDPPHFILDQRERCPFLREDNLCHIICTYGQEALCDICASHPRFHNETDGQTEVGLGLCCEAACARILAQQEPVTFSAPPRCAAQIASLQDRSRPLTERLPDIPSRPWGQILRGLERMDEAWEHWLALLDAPPSAQFDAYMEERQTEYEQIAVYLLYRHHHLRLAALGVSLLRRMAAAHLEKYGEFTFEQQVELCRLFSCEIEYSQENLQTLFELLA